MPRAQTQRPRPHRCTPGPNQIKSIPYGPMYPYSDRICPTRGCARSRDAATPRGVRKSTRGNAFRRTQHPHSPWSPASATRVSRTSHVPILTEFVPRADVRGIGMPRLPVAYAWREEGCARAGGAGAIAPAVCAGVRAMWAPQIFNCFSLASLRQSRRDSW